MRRIGDVLAALFCLVMFVVTGRDLLHGAHLFVAGEEIEVQVDGCDCSLLGKRGHCWVIMQSPATFEPGPLSFQHRECIDEECTRWRQCVSPPEIGCHESHTARAFWLPGDALSVQLQRIHVTTTLLSLLFAAGTGGFGLSLWRRRRRGEQE